MAARIGVQFERLPPLPWKYRIRARGAVTSMRQARSRSPSAVSMVSGSKAEPQRPRRLAFPGEREERESAVRATARTR
jgi:hypothetical protein